MVWSQNSCGGVRGFGILACLGWRAFDDEVSTGSGSDRAKPLPIADLRLPIDTALPEKTKHSNGQAAIGNTNGPVAFAPGTDFIIYAVLRGPTGP